MRQEWIERLTHSGVTIYTLLVGVGILLIAIGAVIDSIERRWRGQLIEALRRAEGV